MGVFIATALFAQCMDFCRSVSASDWSRPNGVTITTNSASSRYCWRIAA